MQRSLWLQKFIDVYRELGTDNLSTLESIYHPNVVFIDPLHKVEGVQDLIASFDRSYTNIISCEFHIKHAFESESEAAVYWTMTFRHKSLNKQEPISVQGHSHLKSDNDVVTFHRDYLDVGAMIYEHVPLLGPVVKKLKHRAGK
ncbi:nuclear transport factor 2 family protein [Vibrio genomosp. F10]|uniref:Transcriptional regulator n=1 Tax=Vibrio genomosp. F10 TaxID=723171 RepID=A0A1B9QXD6_9VIBR|nr:nuclear transport factor 2 family protein [Vibrio genomosp. F10]OCH74448.1 transcriptional regulator [Vibrio genomosp. F10]